jgi:Spy/CpxP family protein refolding chaperone
LLCSAGAEAASLCEQQRSGGQNSDKKQQSESRQEDPPRWKWWLHPDSQRELRLTETQSRKIDDIWNEVAPKQREKMDELRRHEEALAKTIKENTADVSIVSHQVEKVEKLRADTNARRTLMIYRMHLLLTPEQREKVDAMRKKFEEERKRREEEQRRDKDKKEQ